MSAVQSDLRNGIDRSIFCAKVYVLRAGQIPAGNGVAYVEYDVSLAENMQEFVKRLPRIKALPQIFISGEHIGSYEDLTILGGDGRLEKMLIDADMG